MAKTHRPSSVRSVQDFTPVPVACLFNALDIGRETDDAVSVEIISEHIRRLLRVWRQQGGEKEVGELPVRAV